MTSEPIDHPWLDDTHTEKLGDGGIWLSELIAAVDYLRRGIRPDLTVWDAIEEALRHWSTEVESEIGGAPDPDTVWEWEDPLLETLRWTVHLVEDRPGSTAAEAMQKAVRRWSRTMADRYNASHSWR